MKINEIKKTVEQVVRTEYVAEDGTVFCNKEECEKYEESALCVVSSKLKRLCRGLISQQSLLDTGYDEDDIEIFDVQTAEDLDNLKKYLYLTMIKHGSSDKAATRELTAPEELNAIKSDAALYNITAGHEVIIFWSYDWESAWTYGNGSLDGYFDFVRKKYKEITTPEEVKEKEEK